MGLGTGWRLPLFLFSSGLCALVYQVAWLRLLRLVFGASTGASAATLAIFMGGLGLGGLLLGPRADRSSNPLRLYARLEMGIAVAAGVSPWAIYVAAWSYRSLGGTETLGTLVGTLVRLVLATLVLGVPTFLMGGTLPSAVRAATAASDRGRRSLGFLYGTNTLGAVLGAGLTTFLLIEQLGTQRTVLLAALVNLLVAVWAGAVARESEDPAPAGPTPSEVDESGAGAHRGFVVLAAGVVGFVFFLLEIVWYRMLAPILGGSTYTFGVILTVALAGIGFGGWLYSARSRRLRPTLLGFAGSCTLEAVLVLVPFALGDRLALFTQVVRDLSVLGFGGLVVSWFLVAVIVILPAAIVAGYQFPLLVAVLGAGRRDVGREIGLAYGANTMGAILGSVAGGFLVLPWLGATATWVATSVLLVVLGAGAVVLGSRGTVRRRAAWVPAVLGLVALVLATTEGPGAYWRHQGIGAGRADGLAGGADVRSILTTAASEVAWEMDGVESSVALEHQAGYSFAVNGKTDGHAVGDAPTQVMSPLVGAILHPNPRRGLVIGLGTGSSAGWLAAVPSMEQVDVYELEEAILRVARDCAPVNHEVLDDPKVRITIGDGRELLMTTRESYDVIFSEPSNPYRAGISSLFTREFYEAASERLRDGGLLVQWLQAYEVDREVVRTVIATLGTVFPFVELWEVHRGDLLLVASRAPIDHDAFRIGREVAREPYRSALASTWGMAGLEGFYTGFIGSNELTRTVLALDGVDINTDDLPIIEYGFARSLGVRTGFAIGDLRQVAARVGDRPELTAGVVDWSRVDELRLARVIVLRGAMPDLDEIEFGDEGTLRRARARDAYYKGEVERAVEEWSAQDELPETRADRLLLADSMSRTEHPGAQEAIARLAEIQPLEAKVLEARRLYLARELDAATEEIAEALVLYREDPWVAPGVMTDGLKIVKFLGQRDELSALRFFDILAEPFAVEMLRELRLKLRVELMSEARAEGRCVEAFEDREPYPIWEREYLELRRTCYLASEHPLARRASEDLADFLELEPGDLLRFFGSSDSQ